MLVCVVAMVMLLSVGGKTSKAASSPLFSGPEFWYDFDSHDAGIMEIADGWSNGGMFDCTWRQGNVAFYNSKMSLTINKDSASSYTKWSGGEYRTKEFFHYGLYEVKMKPIKNDGVVSSFFTYTGPTDGNQWDEIDIEFLGKDTTKVQFNYFTNGVGKHEYSHNLGFDASKDFHVYGFLWLPNSITWYVDGVAVYQATQNIPKTAGKIMMNVWPGIGVDDWLETFNGNTPLMAEYDWIKYTKQDTSVPSPSATHSGYIDWSTDAGWGQYMLEKSGLTTMVYRYGKNDAWAHIVGDMQNQVDSPNRFKLRVNFIDGNILALTIKLRDIYGNEMETGQVSYSASPKGERGFEIPISSNLGPIKQVILMINSNPYQLNLARDAHCKVEILNAEVYRY